TTAPAASSPPATTSAGEGLWRRGAGGGQGSGGSGGSSGGLLLSTGDALRLVAPEGDPDQRNPRALAATAFRHQPFIARVHDVMQSSWRPADTLDHHFIRGELKRSSEGESTVAVTINRAGKVVEVKLVKRGSHEFLDEIALSAARHAGWLPNPPAELFHTAETVRLLVGYRVKIVLPQDQAESVDPLLPPQARALTSNPAFAAVQQMLQPIQEPTEYLTRKSAREMPYPMCAHRVPLCHDCPWDRPRFQITYEPCAYQR
ncbi:MAG: energy transducer TonB, partial [Myxococcota bacterium]